MKTSERDTDHYAEVMQAGLGPPRGELIGIGEERGGGYRADASAGRTPGVLGIHVHGGGGRSRS